MDFQKFDSRAPADEGRPLHLKHPVTGLPLFDNSEDPAIDNGKPCRVFVRGAEGHEAQRAIRNVSRSRAKEKVDEEDERSTEFHHARLVEFTAPLVVGFENISRGEKAAVAPDDVHWFLNLQLTTGMRGDNSFAEQVSAFSLSRANYLGNSPSAS